MRTVKLALLQRIMATTIYQKRFIQKRKEQGLCIRCGASLDREGVLCWKCLAKANEDNRATYHVYIEAGLCPRCRKNIILGQEKACPECRSKKAEVALEYRKNNSKRINAMASISRKRLRNERKEKGICNICGKRQADTGYVTCGICRQKEYERRQRRKNKTISRDDMKERADNGFCFFCGNLSEKGYRVCNKHLEIFRKNSQTENFKKAHKNIKQYL